MYLSLLELENKLKIINALTEKFCNEEAHREYQNTHKDIEMNRYAITAMADFYASYAYFCFQSKEINQFFEMYIRAQKYGYPMEKRRAFIYKTFVEPNLEIFRLNYMQNLEIMQVEGCIREAIDFEELTYWLIPTGNNDEYYLYDKETDLIMDKFYLNQADNQSVVLEVSRSSYDYLIINNGNWAEIQTYIKSIGSQGKKSYIINNHFPQLLSCLQGGVINREFLSGLVLFANIDEFESYFFHSSSYLPRHFVCTEEERTVCEELIEKIHHYRLNRKNRHGDNVLLSICIPSYNRGKRAYENILHTLQSPYDEEIEIVLSNNGTQNESLEFYEKISQMEDSRVVYFAFDKNQGFALNISQVANLAKGKYILLLSDEDLVNLSQLESIINLLHSEDNDIAIMRTKTDKQGIPYIGTTKPGRDSLLTFMLTSNYMSGIIYNKQKLQEYHLIEYIKQNLDNAACLVYPHMVWELVLCQYGNVMGMDIVLINEGQAEIMEAKSGENIGSYKKIFIPYYATLEGRLDQHEGFLNVINNLEISKNDFDILRELYRRLCAKTNFLVNLSIIVYYLQTDTNISELLEAAYNYSIIYLNEIYQSEKNNSTDKYLEDKAIIKQYYENKMFD